MHRRPGWLTLTEVCDRWGCRPDLVFQYEVRKLIRTIKAGDATFYRLSDVQGLERMAASFESILGRKGGD